MNTAFSILRVVCGAAQGTPEQASFAGMVCSYVGENSGIDRANIHFVPIYTKAHLKKILDTYYDQVCLAFFSFFFYKVSVKFLLS